MHVAAGRRYRPLRLSIPKASSSTPKINKSRRQLLTEGATAAVTAISLINGIPVKRVLAAKDKLSEWERVYLPIDPGIVLLDIAFVHDDPNHGFLLGTRQTILETKDGGSTWMPWSIVSVEEEDFNYRFNSISFKGKEGWIVGKPSILLYTSDAGENWKKIALSSQLPGDIVDSISCYCKADSGLKIVAGASKFVSGSKLCIPPDINPHAHKTKNSRKERSRVQPPINNRMVAGWCNPSISMNGKLYALDCWDVCKLRVCDESTSSWKSLLIARFTLVTQELWKLAHLCHLMERFVLSETI